MATITIEIDIDSDGNVSVSPNPALVQNGDVVRWHVNSNKRGGGSLQLKLPPGADSPFGNEDNVLGGGVEDPRHCNAIDMREFPIAWPEGADSYGYDVDFSGSPLISSAQGTLVRRRGPRVDFSKALADVSEIYVSDGVPLLAPGKNLRYYRKIFPIPWYKRLFHGWCCKSHAKCCCCCCCKSPGLPPPPSPPVPQPGPPTIMLSQGMLAIGSQFYLLITPVGQRCQFAVEWYASGGVGQLTVDLEVQEGAAPGFRTLATGLGPTDQYVYTGQRTNYLFRATVTDARGQSTFDTLSVSCP